MLGHVYDSVDLLQKAIGYLKKYDMADLKRRE